MEDWLLALRSKPNINVYQPDFSAFDYQDRAMERNRMQNYMLNIQSSLENIESNTRKKY